MNIGNHDLDPHAHIDHDSHSNPFENDYDVQKFDYQEGMHRKSVAHVQLGRVAFTHYAKEPSQGRHRANGGER